ncbi:uncharacterized protein PV06_05866 [Exophiala oligosperma]|uniref:Ketoreductase domain-containing protein n=1 Tax=Exophiala oligosperma TaxID=215243 RepID=A0A0D2E3C7_9EURO|nr:uncharacterized protein PV06_05866 [Exophiala oligosperma]KIW42304.1 hypothetical protein PV06_05866 [Exophiala oligosperma]
MAAPFPSPTSKWHSDTYPSLSPTRPELSAKGKTVLITGGGTGIGAETARYFAAAGAPRIAILGRRKQPLLETKADIEDRFSGVEVFIAPTDVTSKSEVDAAFKSFIGEGELNVLVHGAANVGPLDGTDAVEAGAFLESIQLNLRGSLFVAQAFLRHASKDAVAIEVNSSAAHVNFVPKFAAYSVAKLAQYRLWDTVAFANPEMSVFHVQPGVVDTDMNKSAGGVQATGIEDQVALPASFHVWLASPEARFLKGKFLWSNWDVDELKSREEQIATSTQFNIDLVGWPFGESAYKFQTTSKLWTE